MSEQQEIFFRMREIVKKYANVSDDIFSAPNTAVREGETGFLGPKYLFTLPDDVLKRLY